MHCYLSNCEYISVSILSLYPDILGKTLPGQTLVKRQ